MTNSVYIAKYGDHRHFQVFGNLTFISCSPKLREMVGDNGCVACYRHILHLQYNTQDPVWFGYLRKYMNCLDISVLIRGAIPYIGNHLQMKSFVNYLLFHSLQKTFTIQAISCIKIPAKTKSVRKHSQMLPDLQNSQTFSSTEDCQYTVTGLCK